MNDIQSWSEVPAIAHFCSLFRTSFNLLDFDIEELEQALVTDSAEDLESSLIQDLVVRLLKGCSPFINDDITTFNYQMYLRRLFRIKCEEDPARSNPFNKDVAFHSLALRAKVEIIKDLCDFRLDSDDVSEALRSISSDSIRVRPLGQDSGGSTYWYFYGTRLYREDYNRNPWNVPAKKRYRRVRSEDEDDSPEVLLCQSVSTKWQVVCFSEEDWQLLARKFKNCKSRHEVNLDRTLREDFLPVLPRLFAEKEKFMRKRMMDQQLRRSNRSILGQPKDDGSESPSTAERASGEPETEDEVKHRRLQQEKADRILAESLQREETKAGIHLRERHGRSTRASSITSSSSQQPEPCTSSSLRNNQASTSSASTSKPASRRSAKGAGKGGKSRMTNNSLSACLPLLLENLDEIPVVKTEENILDQDNSDDDVQSAEDDGDDTFKPSSPSKNSKRKRKSDKGKNKVKRARRDKERDSASKKKRSKDKKSRSRKEGSRKSETKDRGGEDILSVVAKTGSGNGMSKTKVKGSVLFPQSEEDINIGMYKVLEAMKNHRDAWPFASAVEENYAPNYYKVILFPMTLDIMEDKLDNHEYTTLEQFKSDFASIVANCIKYNGPSNEYSDMVGRLDNAFHKAILRYVTPDESDEDISIEYNNLTTDRKKHRLSQDTPKDEKRKVKEKSKSPTDSNKSAKTKSSSHSSAKKTHKKPQPFNPRNVTGSGSTDPLKDMNKWLGGGADSRRHKRSSAVRSASSHSNSSSDSEVHPPLPSEIPKSKKFLELVKRFNRDSNSKSRNVDPIKRSESMEKVEQKKESTFSIPSKVDSTKPVKKRARPEEFDEKEAPPVKHHHKHHRHSSSNGDRERSAGWSASGESSHKKTSSGHHRSRSTHRKGSLTKGSTSDDSPAVVKGRKSEKRSSTKGHKRVKQIIAKLKAAAHSKGLQVGKGTKIDLLRQMSNGIGGNGHGSSGGGASSGADPDSTRTGKHDSSKGPSSTEPNSNPSGSSKEERKKCLLVNDLPKDGKGHKLSLGTVLPKDAVKLGDYKKTDEDGSEEEEPTTPAHTNTMAELDLLDKLEKTFGPLIKEKARALISEGAAAKLAQKSSKAEMTEEEKSEAEAAMQEEADRKLEPSKGFNRDKSLPNLAAWFKAFGGPSGSGTSKSPSLPLLSPLKRLEDPKSRFKVMGRGIGEDSTHKHKGHPRTPKHTEESWSSSQKEAASSPTMTSGTGTAVEDVVKELQQHKRIRNRKMSTSSVSSQSELGSPSFPAVQDDGRSSGVVVVPPRWVDTATEHWGSQSQSPSSQVSSKSPAGPNSPFSPPISSPPRTPPRPPGPVRVGFYQDMSAASQNSSSPEKINEPHSVNSNAASPATPPSVNPGTPNPNSTPRRDSSSGSNNVPKNYTTSYRGGYAPRYTNSTPSPISQGPSPSGGPLSVGSPNTSQGDADSPHSPSVSSQPPTPTLASPSPGGLNLADYRSSSHHSPSPAFNLSQQHNLRPSSTIHSESISRQNERGPPSVLSLSAYTSSGGRPAYPGSYVNVIENPLFSHHGHSHNHGLSPHPEAAHTHHHIQPAVARYGLTGTTPANTVPQAAHQHQASPIPNMPSSSSIPTGGSIVYGGRPSLNPPTSASQPQTPAYHSNPYTSNPRNINLAPTVYSNPSDRFYPSGKTPDGILSMLPLSTSSSGSSGSTTPKGRNKAHQQQIQQHLNEEREREAASHSHGHGHSQRGSPQNAGKTDLAPSPMNGFQWPHNLASLTQIVNNIPNPMSVNPYLGRGHPHYDPSNSAENMAKYPRVSDQTVYSTLNSVSGAGKSGSAGNSTTAHSSHQEHMQLAKTLATFSAVHAKEVAAANAEATGSTSSSGSGSGRRSGSKSEGKSRGQGSKVPTASPQQMMAASAFNFSSLPSDLALYSKDMDPAALYSASPPALAHAHAHSHRSELYPTSTSSFHTFAAASAAAARTTSGGGATSIPPYQIPPFIGSHPSPYQPQPVSSQPSPFAHSQAPRGIVDSYQQFFQNAPHVMAGLLPPAGYPATYSHPHHALGFTRPGWI